MIFKMLFLAMARGKKYGDPVHVENGTIVRNTPKKMRYALRID